MALRAIPLWLAAAIGFAAQAARADVSAAARAFSDGQAAQLEGNYDHAAESFELAFTIAPSKEALRAAIRARRLANQLPRAATLAQALLDQYGDDAMSAKLANEVIADAKPKLARISVTCSPRCALALSGRSISLHLAPAHAVFAAPGHHVLEATFDRGPAVTREITVNPGDDLALAVAPPPAARAAPPSPSRADAMIASSPAPRDGGGISPVYAIAGGIVTAGLAGAMTWSAIDTLHAHDAYAAAPTPEGWRRGMDKQARTNLLLGGAAAAGVATTLIAVLWTRWHRSPRSPGPATELAISTRDGGVVLSLGSVF
jgi:hypothetical protein